MTPQYTSATFMTIKTLGGLDPKCHELIGNTFKYTQIGRMVVADDYILPEQAFDSVLFSGFDGMHQQFSLGWQVQVVLRQSRYQKFNQNIRTFSNMYLIRSTFSQCKQYTCMYIIQPISYGHNFIMYTIHNFILSPFFRLVY